MKDFSINILGLRKGAHQFEFHLDDHFFKKYGQEVVEKGLLDAKLTLDKRESFIEAQFELNGFVELICDRSLDSFQHPISILKKIVFKFGEEEREVSDEIMVISPQKDKLEIGQLLYEFILLEVPIKKLHPRFGADDSVEDELIYSSSTKDDSQQDDEPIDPRWEALKKLK